MNSRKTWLTVLAFAAIGLALNLLPYARLWPTPVNPKAPGDTTLFGDPSCQRWSQLSRASKSAWLQAVLTPLNRVYLEEHRNGPSAPHDPLANPADWQAVATSVDAFCASAPQPEQLKAMQGATDYLTANYNSSRPS